MRLDLSLDYVKELPEEKFREVVEEAYRSPQRELILDEADDVCSDRDWCKNNGISFLNLTNWDYWAVTAYLNLNLQKQQSQYQAQETATA